MIVTIDGLASVGKSTAARGLAERLGFVWLDPDAISPVVALAAKRRGIDLSDQAAVAALVGGVEIEPHTHHILLDGEDLTHETQVNEWDSVAALIAGDPDMRAPVVALQQRLAAGCDVVTDGWDQGTLVFPEAECKLFLSASTQERGARMMSGLTQKGLCKSRNEVMGSLGELDGRDSPRLQKAIDAIEVDTDEMTIKQLVDHLEKIVRGKMGKT